MTEEILFHEVLARPVSERGSYLDGACLGRPELRAAVEALLAAHEASQNLLDATVDSEPGDRTDATLDLTPGETASTRASTGSGAVIAGRYALVEKIGEGGMGEVWIAQQTEPVKRRVALKLIKSGMDSSSVLARFEQERQALALMDHPNISRVLDGGVTPSGQPFFVMELVNGLPLTRFCDEAKLSPRERLELFIPICQAVQHAHQKGIVHRDLKPANILVTLVDGRPVPKVIDFGVAKATGGSLTDESFATHFGAVIGTLEYMSPEQAGYSGVDVDTRADVYSLGVILYELLTGLRPIDSKRLQKAGLVEMIRVIQEVEPSKPSARLSTDEALPTLAATRQTDPRRLMAMLRGELDWVVMKCLEKERARRYESASDLARDVQRHLSDEPVEARPPSFRYRLWKTLRRNRFVVGAVGAIAAALVVGLGLAIWQAVVATQAQNAALRLASEKEQLALEKGTLANDNADLAIREGQANRETQKQLRRTQGVLFGSQLRQAEQMRESNLWGAIGLLYDLNYCPVEQRDVAWNAAVNATLRKRLRNVPQPLGVTALSPDGTIYATSGVRGIVLLPLSSGEAAAEVPVPDIDNTTLTRLTFCPDNRVLAILGDGPLTLTKPPTPGKVRLLNVLEKKLQGTLEGHTDRVTCVAFSPDGKRLASGSLDGTVRIWDLATSQTTHTLKDHGKPVGAVAFSPDGKRLASGGNDCTVRLWDASTFQSSATWDVDVRATAVPRNEPPPPLKDRGILALDFSPDSKLLAVSSSALKVEFREVASGEVRSTISDLRAPARTLQFHPSGRSVFVDAGLVGQWEVGSGRMVREIHVGGFAAFARKVARVVAGGDFAQPAQLYDFDLPTEVVSLSLHKDVGPRAVAAFTPAGDLLAAAGKKGVHVWDLSSRRVRDVLTGHRNHVTALAIDPSGRVLASADRVTFERPGNPASLRLWNLETGEALTAVDLGNADVRSLAFSRDGKQLATFHWDRSNPQGLPLPVVLLWDVSRAELLRTLEIPDLRWEALGPDRTTLAFHPDGASLLVACCRQLVVYDLTTHQIARRILVGPLGSRTPAPSFLDMAVSPDGSQIATTNFIPQTGPELNLWDFRTGALVQRVSAGRGSLAGYAVRFSREGNTLIVGGEEGVRFVDVQTMQSRGQLPVEGMRSQAIFLSPDGRTLAGIPIVLPLMDRSPGEETVPVRLWDLGLPAARLVFPGRINRNKLQLSHDGRTLFDSSSTGQLHLWDTETATRKQTIDTTKQPVGMLESPDGRYLVGHNSLPLRDPENRPALVTRFDLRTGEFRSFDLGPGAVIEMYFSHDCTLLIVTRPTLGVQVINLLTGDIGPILEEKQPEGCRFNRDKTRLVISTAGPTTVWDWRVGKKVDEPIPEELSSPVVGAESFFRLVSTPLGMTLVDQRIQPPPVTRTVEKIR